MNAADILRHDLVGIADAIKNGETSSEDVTRACVERAEAVQPNLNCFISLEADEAMEAARGADAAMASGQAIGPLHGVPLAHKDMYYREGKVSTCGSKIRKNWVADRTGTVVSRLADAGSIHMGGLNMAEFATGATGHNEHWGHCRNPWNPDHITGGSSSGSGSAVGGRAVYGSLGSDTGGSVRLPATACGVVGLKPTHSLISRYGIMPLSYTMDTVGPLTRSVRDNARMTQVIAGQDPKDTTTSARAVPDLEAQCGRDVKGMRIGVPTSYYFEIASDEMKALIDAAIKVLTDLGIDVVDVPLPDMHRTTALSNIIFPTEACTLHEPWLRERPEDYQEQVRARYEPGQYTPATKYLRALDMRPALAREFVETTLTDVDAMIAPGMPYAVPRVDDTNVAASPKMAATIAEISWCTRPTNFLGVPALSVPCGFTENGLPAGFQLTGRPFSEGHLFRLAHAYQAETDWHTRMPA
jgi:aspartyl-tRNA(Asn)/glutamyl-tRNA(Gln) amidotransferase subunit A